MIKYPSHGNEKNSEKINTSIIYLSLRAAM
jgi:hypothetical protein